jgi:hypothetical protein
MFLVNLYNFLGQQELKSSIWLNSQSRTDNTSVLWGGGKFGIIPDQSDAHGEC